MKRIFLAFVLSILLFSKVFSQDTISYHIAFPNAIHHEAEITININNLDREKLVAIMSKSSPGRYAIHNFGKNIYNLAASENDHDLTIRKIEPDAWEISEFDKDVQIKYTLYANYPNGTYSGIDVDYANLNMPATLMWIQECEEIPAKIEFQLSDTSKWKIATQLPAIDTTKNIYFAPNLQYLMDSPCLLSDFQLEQFLVGEDEEYIIRLALFAEASQDEINVFSNSARRLILEQKEVFGEYPVFKDSSYTFLCSYGPQFHGDGMEHRNSTMISSSLSLSGNTSRLIGTLSHEFFHAWNMERMRPKSLEPFDFTEANISGELWFGEGFTSYYSSLSMCRAGLMEQNKYIANLGRLINYASSIPGQSFGSPVFMSEMASYTDDAAANDETNFSNTFFSYYAYGELVALALDMTLRTKFENLTLDDLMLAMWKKYGKSETPYTNADIQTALGEISNDNQFAQTFFNDHIYGNALPDFENLFDQFGYKLIPKNPAKARVDFDRFSFEGDSARLLSQPLKGSYLYEAGVNRGDLILTIDDQPVTSYPELNFIIGTRKIDDELNVSFVHFGKIRSGTFKIKEDNQLMLVPKERFSIREDDAEKNRLQNWLASRVPE